VSQPGDSIPSGDELLSKFGKSEPQMAVFLKAWTIYAERQEEHGDQVWTASGWRGMLVDMRKKLDRLWFKYWGRVPTNEVNLDSAYDLLNYTAFFIRQVEANNQNGDWPWDV
jgi:hypothetical protein